MNSELSISTEIEGEYDYVRDGDVILIVTANHTYQFVVSDSESRRGLLTGGTLGEGQFNARTSSSLQEGYGVRFDVGLPGSCCRMVTSDVIELVCVRQGESATKEIIKFPASASAMERPCNEI
jgi:hypothetical protein